MAVCIKVRYQ